MYCLLSVGRRKYLAVWSTRGNIDTSSNEKMAFRCSHYCYLQHGYFICRVQLQQRFISVGNLLGGQSMSIDSSLLLRPLQCDSLFPITRPHAFNSFVHYLWKSHFCSLFVIRRSRDGCYVNVMLRKCDASKIVLSSRFWASMYLLWCGPIIYIFQ